MNARRDPERLIHAFLMEGQTELADPVYDAVRAEIERKRQRVVIGPWRMPTMNKFVPIGLGAAAVVVAFVLGTQFLGRPAPGGAGGAPSAEPSATASPDTTPSPTAWSGLPQGPFVVTGADVPVQVTLDIASPGWVALPEFGAVSKDDDSLDPPETVGAALLAWAWPAGTGFNVYGDPCQWLTTLPESPATTPDEIAAAFAAQASTDATAPVDVTVGGFAGKAVTLHVPMEYDLPNATREEEFADCDNDVFAFYGVAGETGEARNAQGAGQIDELWILDVNGSIVIIDAALSPATPADLVEEVRTLAESATFEAS
jgi:hypothetical protein